MSLSTRTPRTAQVPARESERDRMSLMTRGSKSTSRPVPADLPPAAEPVDVDQDWLMAATRAAQSIASAHSGSQESQSLLRSLMALRTPANALERVIFRSLLAEVDRLAHASGPPQPAPIDSPAAPIAPDEPQSPQLSSSDRLVERALSIVERRAFDPQLRLIDVATETGVSEWQLSTRIKSRTGRGFWSHLNGVRVSYARQLLATTNAPVGVIALKVGYRRVSDLDRHFRRHFDLTPSAFRRSLL